MSYINYSLLRQVNDQRAKILICRVIKERNNNSEISKMVCDDFINGTTHTVKIKGYGETPSAIRREILRIYNHYKLLRENPVEPKPRGNKFRYESLKNKSVDEVMEILDNYFRLNYINNPKVANRGAYYLAGRYNRLIRRVERFLNLKLN